MLEVLRCAVGAAPGAFIAGSFVLNVFGLATRPWGDIDVYVPTGAVAQGLSGEPLVLARRAAAVGSLLAAQQAVVEGAAGGLTVAVASCQDYVLPHATGEVVIGNAHVGVTVDLRVTCQDGKSTVTLQLISLNEKWDAAGCTQAFWATHMQAWVEMGATAVLTARASTPAFEARKRGVTQLSPAWMFGAVRALAGVLRTPDATALAEAVVGLLEAAPHCLAAPLADAGTPMRETQRRECSELLRKRCPSAYAVVAAAHLLRDWDEVVSAVRRVV